MVVPKVSTPEHLDENLGALDWELSTRDWQRLAEDFPNQKQKSDRVPLDYEADKAP